MQNFNTESCYMPFAEICLVKRFLSCFITVIFYIQVYIFKFKFSSCYSLIFSFVFTFMVYIILNFYRDFPGGSDGKEYAYNAGDPGLIPELGRSPGEGNGNPLQYPCLENLMDKESGGLQSMGSQRVEHD